MPAPPNAANGLMDFFKSEGGRSVLEGLFGMLASKGQSNQADKQSAANQAMSREQLSLMDKQGGISDRLSRDQSLATHAPTGWDQQYLQEQLMKNLGLQKLLQPKQLWHPNEKVMERLATMPRTPQLAVPEDWKSTDPFGRDMSVQSLAGRQGTLDLLSGGRGPGLDFSRMGLSPEEAQRLNQLTGGYRSQVGNEYERTTGRDALQTAIQPQGGSGGGGSRIGGALSGAASGAAIGSFLPGPGTLIGGILGGLGGLFGGGKKQQPQQQAQVGGLQPSVMPRQINPYTQGVWGQPPAPVDPTRPAPEALRAAMRRPRMAYGY